jgi:hypothetical protein
MFGSGDTHQREGRKTSYESIDLATLISALCTIRKVTGKERHNRLPS